MEEESGNKVLWFLVESRKVIHEQTHLSPYSGRLLGWLMMLVGHEVRFTAELNDRNQIMFLGHLTMFNVFFFFTLIFIESFCFTKVEQLNQNRTKNKIKKIKNT